MERYEIEAFLAVADELHFGRAAQRLGMSTGRVSQTIKAIERRFGATLFERTSRKVTLTPIGRGLADDLRPALDQIRIAIERAIAAGRGFDGVLDVGFVGAAAGRLVLRANEIFRVDHAETDVRIHEVQITDWNGIGLGDRTDMVLTSRPFDHPEFVIGPTLISEQRMLALPADHRLAARSALTLEDLAEVTLLRTPPGLPAAFRDDRCPRHTPSGRPIRHGRIAHTFQEILALIGSGAGAFVVGAQVTEYYLRPEVTYLPILGAPPVEWGFVWPVGRDTARVHAFQNAALRVGSGQTRSARVGASARRSARKSAETT